MINSKRWAAQKFRSNKDQIVGYKNTDKEKISNPTYVVK